MGDFQYYQYYQPLKVGSASEAALSEVTLPSAVPAADLLEAESEAAEPGHGTVSAASRLLCVRLVSLRGRVTVKMLAIGGGKAIATGCIGYGLLHVAALSGVDQASMTVAAGVVLFGIDARVSFVCALVLLMEVPLLQHFGYLRYSDTAAVAAFYALALGVLMATIEYTRETRQESVPGPLPEVTYRLRR